MFDQTPEAYVLGQVAYERRARGADLTSVEGGRLDARARREASPAFLLVVRYVVVLAVVLFLAGGISVTLTSGTVALLQTNATTSSQIKEARALNDDLRIERSLLTRGDRISRIATQNLGMVYASDAEVLRLD